MENAIYCALLALHNLALVMCVAGPFYMGRMVAARGKHGKKLFYRLDSVVEDVITSQPMLCWLAIIVLFATGFGFPVVHLLFHGQMKEVSTVAVVALGVKLVFVLGIVGILFYGTSVINPKLKVLFAKFKEGEPADPETEKQFFALRGVRKKWCDRCLVLGVLVLLVSPVLRFSEPETPELAARQGRTEGSTEAVLLVTNLKTSLSTDELMEIARERQPKFRAIPELHQGFLGHDTCLNTNVALDAGARRGQRGLMPRIASSAGSRDASGLTCLGGGPGRPEVTLMDEFAQQLTELVGGKARDAEIEPTVHFNVTGDCIEFLASPDRFYAERIDKRVTVYYGKKDNQIMGALLKGVRELLDQMSVKCPGFAFEIVDRKVRLAVLLRAGLWTSKPTFEGVKLTRYCKVYHSLIEAAEKAGVEAELVEV